MGIAVFKCHEGASSLLLVQVRLLLQESLSLCCIFRRVCILQSEMIQITESAVKRKIRKKILFTIDANL